MISRWKSPSLSRNIASSVVLSPKALARAYEEKDKDESSNKTQDKSSNDPWAPVFEDIPSSVPPVPSTLSRPHLHPRFFTSRPGPKTFFNSNTPRRHVPGKREYGTDAKGRGSSSNDNNTPPSAWDHVFEGIDDAPASTAPWPQAPSFATSKFPTTSARRPPRRQAMTAREISAFDDMFDMIFTAVNKNKESGEQSKEQAAHVTQVVEIEKPAGETSSHLDASSSSSTSSPDTTPSSSTTEPAAAAAETTTSPQSVGRTPSGETFDLFGKLRRHSNRMRRTSATAELLDRKKEEMELCDTDRDLLDWAMRELGLEVTEPSSSTDSSSELARYLANPTYSHILAHLMYTFRTKYRDAHTALALFSHVKRRSIHSYVFGCTTPAYNELLEARWTLDGSLKGTEDALVEMRTNGVSTDKRTRAFVDRIRREVGERVLARSGGDTESDVWDALARVEGYVKRKGPDQSVVRGKVSKLDARKKHWNEEWKSKSEDFKLGQDRLSLRP